MAQTIFCYCFIVKIVIGERDFMQITGAYRCVQNALYKVTCIIRDNLSPNEVLAESRMKSNWKANKGPLKGNHFGHGKSAFPSGRFLQKVFFTSFLFTISQFPIQDSLVLPRLLGPDHLGIFVFAECWGTC